LGTKTVEPVSIASMKCSSLCRMMTAVGLLALCSEPQYGQEKAKNAAGLKPFAGTWKGICADGKEFVVLSLRVDDGGMLAGEISLANFTGEEGQCGKVVNPPSPQYAKKIAAASIENKVVSFRTASSMEFEMALEDAQAAKVRFLGTPVEDRPWRLARSAD
jgi:hypothetical protein